MSEEAEPFAYGALALKPWEFWRLTPGEFLALVEGFRWRDRRQMELTAWACANLMNMWQDPKRPAITSDALLGPAAPRRTQRAAKDAESERQKGLALLREVAKPEPGADAPSDVGMVISEAAFEATLRDSKRARAAWLARKAKRRSGLA